MRKGPGMTVLCESNDQYQKVSFLKKDLVSMIDERQETRPKFQLMKWGPGFVCRTSHRQPVPNFKKKKLALVFRSRRTDIPSTKITIITKGTGGVAKRAINYYLYSGHAENELSGVLFWQLPCPDKALRK